MNLKTVDALLLPLLNGLISLPSDAKGVFLNALPDTRLSKTGLQVTCIQTNRSEFLALQKLGLQVETQPAEEKSQDFVFCALGKNKQQAQYDMARGQRMLKSGGYLICAARNDSGSSSLVKLAKQIGCTSQLSKFHHKVFWGQKNNDIDVQKQVEWERGGALQYVPAIQATSAPIIYGWNKVDKGSELLASCLDDTLKGHVADLGAGWGYLSCSILSKCPQVQQLSVIESEHTALQAAQKNLASFENDCSIEYLWQDVAQEKLPQLLDCVVMNPPFHSGKDADISLGVAFIVAARKMLRPRGRLLMVANRHLPYEAELTRQFRNWKVVTETPAFKVIEAQS